MCVSLAFECKMEKDGGEEGFATLKCRLSEIDSVYISAQFTKFTAKSG